MRLRNFKSSLYCRKNDSDGSFGLRETVCAGDEAVRFYELDLYRYTQNHT